LLIGINVKIGESVETLSKTTLSTLNHTNSLMMFNSKH